jgi:adenosylmethionine-8-amino-7-oxononanoate aminotransferase
MDIRQRGLMVGIELHPDGERRLGYEVCAEIRARGVILRPLGNVLVLMPPLSIEPAQLVQLVEATVASIQAVCP